MQLLRRLRFTLLLMSMMTLAACGGDGGLTVGDGGTTDNVTLTVTKSDGNLSAANNITVMATVLDSGSAVANKTVTFSLAVDGSAILDPESGTATTDANGLASIVVKVTDVKGSVSVVASYDSAKDDISINSDGDGVKVIVGEPEAAAIRLFASSTQLASSGAESIELFAIAKDADNNLLEGVTINFSADSGALEKVFDDAGESSNVTGPDGKVAMLLSTQDEPSNRVIQVKVTSGDITDFLDIDVVDTLLTLTGSASLAIADETNYIVKVLDSDGNGVAKTEVVISLSGVSTESPAGTIAEIAIPTTVTTDAEGQATVKVTGTTGGTNSIVVTALGATASQGVSVQPDSFLFTNFNNGTTSANPSTTPIVPDVSLIQTASVTLTWKRDGVNVPDATEVKFTTTRGVLSQSEGTTLNGQVTVTLESSDAGKALVTFFGSDIVGGVPIELTNQLEFEFFADTAASIITQTSPSKIAPNGQTSTISVIVRDLAGNLVKNKTIDFKLSDNSGGTIFPASAVTDSNGSASTVYTSNSTSKVNGVTIKGTVRDKPTVTESATLTVSKRSAFIILQTGNTILQQDNNTYNKQYSVQVTDLNGAGIKDLTLTISAIPKDYHKGRWVVIEKEGKFDHYAPLFSTTCFNEDGSNGGEVDSLLDVNEDVNGDGVLTPGNVVTVPSEVTTDVNGSAMIDIRYGENYGGWVDIELIATGKVNGTENIAQRVFRLSSLDTDVTVEANPPAAFIWPEGPFGVANVCTDAN